MARKYVERALKSKIWNEAEFAKNQASTIRSDLATARAQLEEAQHEIRRLKNHRGRVKNALLEGVKLAEILAKSFGVTKK